MRKTCVQMGFSLWKLTVRKSLRKCVECITTGFSTIYTRTMRRAIHSFIAAFLSVTNSYIPTIHTPYNEQKYLTLNILVLSLSGELS